MKRIYSGLVACILLLSFISCEDQDIVETNILLDIDGNLYDTIHIDGQIWMAQNLKVTRYPDGSAIPHITDSIAWSALLDADTASAFCYYDNNKDTEYGALYTYAAAIANNWTNDNDDTDRQGICPDGWHLPSDDEWKTLEAHLGMSTEEADEEGWRGVAEGHALKSSSGWENTGYFYNNYGFSALPSGYRDYETASYNYSGYYCAWWTSTKHTDTGAYYRSLLHNNGGILRNTTRMSYGFSVRCILD